jgi:hypothetical protein
VDLYVCWGTFQTPRPGGHPCHNAHKALRKAGWDPDVHMTYGWDRLGPLNRASPGRNKVRELTGEWSVPVLVTDEGEIIPGSDRIAAWAEDNPAAGAERPRRRS